MALFVHETSDFNKHQLSGTFPQSTPLSNNIACQMTNYIRFYSQISKYHIRPEYY